MDSEKIWCMPGLTRGTHAGNPRIKSEAALIPRMAPGHGRLEPVFLFSN